MVCGDKDAALFASSKVVTGWRFIENITSSLRIPNFHPAVSDETESIATPPDP